MLTDVSINKISNWTTEDSEELFKINWKNNRSLMIENNWDDQTVIQYEYDRYGLRNPLDVDISESIMVLGCSYTLGEGIHREMTWGNQLAEMIGTDVYNAGMSGASSDSVFRIADYLIPKYKPKSVFCLMPGLGRYEFYTGDGDLIFFNGFRNQKPKKLVPALKEYNHIHELLINEKYYLLNRKKTILAISYICQSLDIPFYYKNLEDYNLIDRARDLEHAGPKTNNKVAIDFNKELEET